jgi:hypothetical protein
MKTWFCGYADGGLPARMTALSAAAFDPDLRLKVVS